MTKVQTLTFDVSGMHCASCGILVDEAVEELDGVARSDTDSRRGRTIVRADVEVTTVADITNAITEVGYTAVLCFNAAPPDGAPPIDARERNHT